MIELLLALGLGLLVVVQTIFWFAVGTVRRVAAATPAYLHILALGTIVVVGAGLVLIPIFVGIKVFTGWAWTGYTAAVIAVVFTCLLALLWTPLALFIGAVLHPLHPIRAGRRYVRSVAVVLFAELMFAMGLLLVPFHNNIGAIPFFLLAGVAVVLASLLWGGVAGPRFFRTVAVVALLFVVASFFLPQTFRAVSDEGSRIDGAIAATVRGERSSNGHTFEVGSNWVEKAVSKDVAWKTETDASVWIHTGKAMYVLEPDGSIKKSDRSGNMVPAPPCWPSGVPCLDLGGADKISFKAVGARAKVMFGPTRPGNV